MADPDEGHCLSFFKKDFHPPEENGIALRDDGFAASWKFSRHGEELLYIPFEEGLHENFFVIAPMLDVVEIVYDPFERDSVQGCQLVLDGLKILDLLAELLGDLEGFHVH